MTRLCIVADDQDQALSLCAALQPLWPDAICHAGQDKDADHILVIGNASCGETTTPVWRINPKDGAALIADYTLQGPIRLAVLVQKLKEQAAQHRILNLGDHMLDQGQRRWIKRDGTAVDLTEKEVALLSYLAGQHPTPASREDLLREVWKYADGADTHTVETHLYRLRQKIEQNPGDPAIVVSTKQGYILGVL